MLVENTQPNTRAIGKVYLGPGITDVETKTWEGLKSQGFDGPIKELIRDGVIKVHAADTKVTIAMVEKTYEVPTLRGWLQEAKGPLKGAIKKQIATITDDSGPEEKAVL